MEWYQTNGSEQDVVVSSRVRFARNLKDYPFEPRLDVPSAKEIIEKISGIFGEHGYTAVDFTALDSVKAASYAERRLVSTEFAAKKTPHTLLENKDKKMEIMVCEEDHLRIQCIMAGLALEECYANACEADDLLDEKASIAYSETLGYLTHCPTNLGTGMRASVMMFLPALTMNKQMPSLQKQLAKIGIVIRGMSGEGSSADGCLYQISNQVTLGITEDETIQKLSDVVKQIMELERDLRSKMTGETLDRLEDKIGRSVGVLHHATMISSGEFLNLYADARLGIALGFLTDVPYTALDSLLAEAMPAGIVDAGGEEAEHSEIVRDKIRARLIREKLAV